jgi:hypothetical protein
MFVVWFGSLSICRQRRWRSPKNGPWQSGRLEASSPCHEQPPTAKGAHTCTRTAAHTPMHACMHAHGRTHTIRSMQTRQHHHQHAHVHTCTQQCTGFVIAEHPLLGHAFACVSGSSRALSATLDSGLLGSADVEVQVYHWLFYVSGKVRERGVWECSGNP